MRSGRATNRHELSPREREVLDLMAKGCTNGEIAERLSISFPTAKSHVSAIIGKLGVDTREEAVRLWREQQGFGARFGRGFQAFAGGIGIAKVAAVMGVAVATVAGTAALVAVLNTGPPPVAPAAQVAPTVAPTPVRGERIDLVTLAEAEECRRLGDQADPSPECTTTTIGLQRYGGSYRTYESHDGLGYVSTGGTLADSGPSLLMSSRPACPGVIWGMTDAAEADHVEIAIGTASPFSAPLLRLPPEIGLDWRYWVATVTEVDDTAVTLVDADGAALETEGWTAVPPGTFFAPCDGRESNEPAEWIRVLTIPAGDTKIALSLSPWRDYTRHLVFEVDAPEQRVSGFAPVDSPMGAGFPGDRFDVVWGSVDESVSEVEVVFSGGETERVTPVAAPAEAGTGLRYWMVAENGRGDWLELRFLDADGNEIESRLWYNRPRD